MSLLSARPKNSSLETVTSDNEGEPMNEQMEKRNGFALGDAVKLPCVDEVFEVVDLTDPSIIKIRAPNGRIVSAGWRILSRVPVRVAS